MSAWCMDAKALATCKKWGRYTKQRNGCNAYASGWKKGKYNCPGCGKVSRNYPACSLSKCNLLCEDLYGSWSHKTACKSACKKYSTLVPGRLNLIGSTMPKLIIKIQLLLIT